jgi:ParB family chromosome partitioning protein
MRLRHRFLLIGWHSLPNSGRADEGTLSRLLVESTILLAAARTNPAAVLRDAASIYKIDTNAIMLKIKQEFAAKEKAKKLGKPTPPVSVKTKKVA